MELEVKVKAMDRRSQVQKSWENSQEVLQEEEGGAEKEGNAETP